MMDMFFKVNRIDFVGTLIFHQIIIEMNQIRIFIS